MVAVFHPRFSAARRFFGLIPWLLLGSLAAAEAADPGAPAIPARTKAAGTDLLRFDRDIAPILAHRCLTCHQASKAKGQYRLDTLEWLQRPGRSGEAPITLGHPERSALHQLLVATDPEDRMPQDADPLPAGEIALIARWIREGARSDGLNPLQRIDEWAPAPSIDPPERYPRPVPIHAVAFAPGAPDVAIGGYHEILLRNAENGQLIARLRGVARQTQALAFSPDGRRVAAASGTPGRAGEVTVFELPEGRRRPIAGSGDLMTSVAFSPDGTRLALAGADNTLRVVNLTNGQEIVRSEHHADWVLDVAFDADGTRLVTASRDKTVRLLETATGQLDETYAGHGGAVFAARFALGGKAVLSGGRDRELHLWQVSDARRLASFGPLPDEVLRIVGRGDRVWAGLANGEIRELRVGEKRLESLRTLGRHTNGLTALALDPRPGASRAASAGHDGRIEMWELSEGRHLGGFDALPGWPDASARVTPPERAASPAGPTPPAGATAPGTKPGAVSR